MSTTTHHRTDPGRGEPGRRPTTCTRVTDTLWVVEDRMRGLHLGRIERTIGAFDAYDGAGRSLGRFETLRFAQRRIETARRG